jgi:3-oxoacyl-[acyl-carrier-protein] synthase-3
LPPAVVTNQDIESLFETSDDWIVERSGIRQRRAATGPFVAEKTSPVTDGLGTTATLAVAAGRSALEMAGLTADRVGAVLVCTSTPDLAMPATSAAVAGALGAVGGALDLNAACAGFTYGLVTAAGLISGGLGPTLVIGAETMSRLTNWEDRSNAFLFGDGAGAVVLEPTSDSGSLLGWDIGSDGSLLSLLYAEHGSGMVMNGREIFRKAVRATEQSAKAALEQAKVDPSEIALFVPHQANQRIMDAVAERLGIPQELVASTIDRTGNTSAASIPLTLVDAAEEGVLKEGDIVLLAGFGAGMTWASVVWRWGS